MGNKIAKVLFSIGIVALWFYVEKDSLHYLLDWSTAELVGYNVTKLLILGVVIFVIYKLFKPKGN